MANVLVADESAETRAQIEAFTRGGAYQCLLASGFDEALRFGTRTTEKIDILLTSLMLVPYHAGHLANRLKPLHPGMKVLFMSGLEPRVVQASGILAPGSQLLSKPFSKEGLLGALDACRKRGRLWSELAAAYEAVG
jgi:two-component system, cell cycle sensor histidine kinase and response regulator CckA